jgi:hypothetical protein
LDQQSLTSGMAKYSRDTEEHGKQSDQTGENGPMISLMHPRKSIPGYQGEHSGLAGALFQGGITMIPRESKDEVED